jgi:hypothetical protein
MAGLACESYPAGLTYSYLATYNYTDSEMSVYCPLAEDAVGSTSCLTDFDAYVKLGATSQSMPCTLYEMETSWATSFNFGTQTAEDYGYTQLDWDPSGCSHTQDTFYVLSCRVPARFNTSTGYSYSGIFSYTWDE